MPLQIQDGVDVPINENFALSGRSLDIGHRRQKQSNWCWAACMDMVINNGTDKITQCELASLAFSVEGCCNFPTSSLCNRPLAVQSLDGNSDIRSEWLRQNYDVNYNKKELQFSVLKEQIDSGLPVEAGLRWTQGGGHAIMLSGWDTVEGKNWITVIDPLSDEKRAVEFYNLLSAFGQGNLLWYWTNISLNKQVIINNGTL